MKVLFPFFGIFFLVLFDAWTKYIAENFLSGEIWIIPHIFSLQYTENIGVAFSFPITGFPLKILTCALIAGIIYFYTQWEKKKNIFLVDIAYLLIIAGAIGNAWERIFKEYVVDFFSLEKFAIFNVADIYISIGALLLFYFYFFIEKKGV